MGSPFSIFVRRQSPQLATFDRPSLDPGFASDKSDVLDSVGMKHRNYPHYCVSVSPPSPFLSFFFFFKCEALCYLLTFGNCSGGVRDGRGSHATW